METDVMDTQTKAANSLSTDTPKFYEQEWDNGTFDIQSWLKRAPWQSLKNSQYGIKPEVAPPNPALWDDPLLMRIYQIDIATFLTAERISMINISKMVSQAPDEASQVFLATQALDEARHYEVFCKRLADFAVAPEERDRLIRQVTTPQMQNFYDLIDEQVDKGDFASALLAHNVVLEGMAYPVYRYEIKYWSRFDKGLSQIIQGAFADEVHHVTFGEAMIRQHCKRGHTTKASISKLAREFHLLMKEVFEGVISHYIGLYQEAANAHMDLIGDIEIFPGHIMANITEEDQVRLLLKEIQDEHHNRLERIGLSY